MYKKIFYDLLLFICPGSDAQVREISEAVKPKKEFTGITALQKKSQVLSVAAGAPNKVADFLNFGGAINQSVLLPVGIKPGGYILQVANDGEKVISRAFIAQ